VGRRHGRALQRKIRSACSGVGLRRSARAGVPGASRFTDSRIAELERELHARQGKALVWQIRVCT
jgi:hypothetical protein